MAIKNDSQNLMVTLNLNLLNKMTAKLWYHSTRKVSFPKALVTSRKKFWASSNIVFLDRAYEVSIVVVAVTICKRTPLILFLEY